MILWPSGATRRYRSGSTLAQIIVSSLTIWTNGGLSLSKFHCIHAFNCERPSYNSFEHFDTGGYIFLNATEKVLGNKYHSLYYYMIHHSYFVCNIFSGTWMARLRWCATLSANCSPSMPLSAAATAASKCHWCTALCQGGRAETMQQFCKR